jgi:hypothetical protein
MTPENFVYWVQGFFEISGSETLSKEQVQVIKDHLSLVLTKKTPEVTITNPTPFIYPMPSITCGSSGVVPLNGNNTTDNVKSAEYCNNNISEEDFKLFMDSMQVYK